MVVHARFETKTACGKRLTEHLLHRGVWSAVTCKACLRKRACERKHPVTGCKCQACVVARLSPMPIAAQEAFERLVGAK